VIVIPPSTSPLCIAIIHRAQQDIPILENPIGSNRSPEIDEMCHRFGVPLASYWCALWTSNVWKDSGAEIPPVDDAKGWHPAKAETWREWAFATNRFSSKPGLGFAVLYGVDGNKPAHHIGACVVSLVPILMDLEGNTSETGFSREGELTGLKRVNGDGLIGYVSPEPLGGVSI
jgi:hypothetical protein